MSAPVDVADPAPPQHPRTAGSVVRRVTRTVGELLITAGLVLLLFCAYQLWWTNVESAAATATERQQIVQQWDTGRVPLTPRQTPPTVTVKPGKGFALLYIPRLRDKVWGLPVIEGVGLDVLAKGAGHYPGTALPGQVGNFALAAHRATHNEPFRDFDQLRAGDKVYVQTQYAWYTYVLDKDKIVAPTDVWVVDPVPGRPNATPTRQLITLTTCNPRWASYQRWIWWGHQTGVRPVDEGAPDGITGTD